MERKLVLEFTKMNGAGNDFIVLDNRFYYFSDEALAALAARLCPRRFGVGADGLLALALPREALHHYRMRYFNADGSAATMCGNGARCLARFARLAGLEPDAAEGFRFETDAGPYRAVVDPDPAGPVCLYVPDPRDFRPNTRVETPLPEGIEAVHFIWTGTEHAVCFVDDVDQVPVADWGARLRRDAAFGPRGANVNFVQPPADGQNGAGAAHLRVRTFEKGVEAETLACGTGALASALVARLTGRIESEDVALELRGGRLGVRFTLTDGQPRNLSLEGPAEVVYRGTLELEPGMA